MGEIISIRKDELMNINDKLDISLFDEEYDLKTYTKYPVTGLLTMGSSVAATAQTLANNAVGLGGLYRCVFPSGVTGALAQAKDGSGALGTIINDTGIAGQARWEKATSVLDPTAVFMGAALVSIEMQLGEIQSMQESMMEFIEAEKEAEVKGNLKTLSEIVSDYKYYWDNEQYKVNQHIIVAGIKKEANQEIIFYKNIIEKSIKKSAFLKSDHELDNRVISTQRNFRNYQLAIYLYSFSTLLEVMLMQNFKADYIDSILSNLATLSMDFRMLYTDAYNKLDKDGKYTIGNYVRKGVSAASKVTGEFIHNVPILGKGPVDEFLIASSKLLDETSIRKMETTREKIISSKYGVSSVFIDSLQNVKRLYNNPIDMIVDNENIYVKCIG